MGTASLEQRASAVTHYAFDGMGGLQSVTLPDGTLLEYVLDGLQRRVAKKRNGVVERRWLYDGQIRVVAEVDGAGNVSRFVYGTFGHSPDYMVRGGVTYRFVHDSLGSVRLVVNSASGAVAQRLDYDAWGNVLADSSPGFQPFGFAGGVRDADTKFVHFGFRDYDAQVGRWTAKDPVRFGGGDSNLYSYALNNPTNVTDSDGRSAIFNNLVGHVWAGWGVLLGGHASLNWGKYGPYVLVTNHPGQFIGGRPQTTAWGNYICTGRAFLPPDKIEHELAHIPQHYWMGELYFPAHLAAQAYSKATTGDTHRANPLERGPMSTPPTPLPF